MKREYDDDIDNHYKVVAQDVGLSPQSTMADQITRKRETDAISSFVRLSLSEGGFNDQNGATIMDVGCGNGYTLSVLAELFPLHRFIGVEKSDDLRALAESRFKSNESVEIIAGDIRDSNFSQGHNADVLICQRVLINLLDKKDQLDALLNISRACAKSSDARASGKVIFIECFQSGLDLLNEAREEFDLETIPPAHHNLYLNDEFFDIDELRTVSLSGFEYSNNFLSTHYFVTRVLHACMIPSQKLFKRNSEFVKFFTEAIAADIGKYSPLQLRTVQRVSD